MSWFDYSLNCADGNLPVAEGCLSSGCSRPDDDMFFRVSKERLRGSEQFQQITNPANKPRLARSGMPRSGYHVGLPSKHVLSGYLFVL